MALGGNSGGGTSAGAIKAGEAFFKITGDDQELRKLLNKNIDRIKRFGQTIRNIGIGVAGAGGLVLAPLVGLFKTSLDKAANTEKLAQRLDSTAESISRVGYAADITGVQIEDWVKAAEKMNEAALKSAKGGVDQSIAFLKMGVSAQDFVKMGLEDKLLLVADALEKAENPLEKAQILSGLFGDEFGKLIPLFKGGRDGLRDMLAEASQVGSVINSDDAKQALQINKELNKVWISLKSVLYEIGISVLGFGDSIKEGTDTILNILSAIREWIKENRVIVTTIASITIGITVAGIALATFGFAITGIIAGLTALMAIGVAIISVVFSPFMLKIVAITAAIAGIIYVFTEFTSAGNDLKNSLVTAFHGIVETFQVAFGGILDALKKGDLALAGKIAMVGLQAAWQEGIMFLTDVWIKFKGFFVDVFRDAVAAIRTIWTNVYAWLMDKTVWVIGKILENIGAVTDTFGITDDLEKQAQDMRRVAREDVERERADREKEIAKERAKQQAESDAFRASQRQEAMNKLNALKIELAGLAKQAAAPKEDAIGIRMKEEEIKRKDMERLGDSVRGLFTSADYKGALGLGKANDYAKKAYEVQKEALKQLVQINQKLDPVKFE
jgi:hypothetical protein